MKQILCIIVAVTITVACSEKVTPSKTTVTAEQSRSVQPLFHKSHEPKKADAPFSDAVQVGNMFFLSGQIGMDQKERKLVAGGIEAETTQTLENIKDVLAQHGMDMSNVVKAMVVLDDIENFAAFNKIYTSYLPQKPARTTYAAAALAAGAKIEIEVIAVKSEYENGK